METLKNGSALRGLASGENSEHLDFIAGAKDLGRNLPGDWHDFAPAVVWRSISCKHLELMTQFLLSCLLDAANK